MERQKESMRGMPQKAKVYITRSGRRSAFDSGDVQSPDVDVDARREKKREMVRQRHADALELQKQRREAMDAKYEQIEAARTKIYAEDCKQWSRHQTRASRRLHSKLMRVMLDAWLAHKAAYDKCAGSDRNVDLACESMLSLLSESASEGGVSTQKSQLSFERVGTNAPMAAKVAKSEMAGMALEFLSPSVRAEMEEKEKRPRLARAFVAWQLFHRQLFFELGKRGTGVRTMFVLYVAAARNDAIKTAIEEGQKGNPPSEPAPARPEPDGGEIDGSEIDGSFVLWKSASADGCYGCQADPPFACMCRR